MEKTLLGVYYGSAQLEAPTGIAATTPPYVIALVENLKRITGKDKVLVTVINSLFGDSDKTFLKVILASSCYSEHVLPALAFKFGPNSFPYYANRPQSMIELSLAKL